MLDKSIASVCEAFARATLEDSTLIKDCYPIKLAESRVSVLKESKAPLAVLQELRETTEVYNAKEIARNTYRAQSKREEACFEDLCGFRLEKKSPELRGFRVKIRSAIYKLLYNEQNQIKIETYLYPQFAYFYDCCQQCSLPTVLASNQEAIIAFESLRTDIQMLTQKVLLGDTNPVYIESYLRRYFSLFTGKSNESDQFYKRAKIALSQKSLDKEIVILDQETLLLVLHIILATLEKGKKKHAVYAELATLCSKRSDYVDSFPFVSICDKKGKLNREYWVDNLNAKAKKNGEKPLADNCSVKKYTDYDVILINTAPPQDSASDSTNLRCNGAVTPAFCAGMLSHVRQVSEGLGKTCKATQDVTSAIFSSRSVNQDEKLLYLQNEFFNLFGITNNARGDTKRLLDKLGIKVTTAISAILFNPISADRRKSQNPSQSSTPIASPSPSPRLGQSPSPSPRDSGLLRVSSSGSSDFGRESLSKSGSQGLSLLRLQDTRRRSSSVGINEFLSDDIHFDAGCKGLQDEVDRIRRGVTPRGGAEVALPEEDIVDYIANYTASLKILSAELKKFGSTLKLFADGLEAESLDGLEKVFAESLKVDSASPPQTGYFDSMPDGALPQIPKMEPDKFLETSDLLLLFQETIDKVTKLLDDSIVPEVSQAATMLKVGTDSDEYVV